MNQNESILPWFEQKQQESAGFKVEMTDLPKPTEEELKTGGYWHTNEGGRTLLERADGRFFRAVYAMVSGARREIGQWGQPLIKEADRANFHGQSITGYISLGHNYKDRYLVQAKAEPGNTSAKGNLLLAPTIQASFSNIRTHGNKVPLWSELGLDIERLENGEYGEGIETRIQQKDGGRFLDKNNLFVFQPVSENIKIPTSHIWATREAIRELQKKGLVNEHLNEALGMFG